VLLDAPDILAIPIDVVGFNNGVFDSGNHGAWVFGVSLCDKTNLAENKMTRLPLAEPPLPPQECEEKKGNLWNLFNLVLQMSPNESPSCIALGGKHLTSSIYGASACITATGYPLLV
jgi:hypothetical protein